MSVNGFGRIVTGTMVEQAMLEHLKLWLGTYVAEVAAQSGKPRTFFAPPRSFDVWSEWTGSMPEDATPAIFVASPGIAEEPQKRGDAWAAKWLVEVGALVSARTKSETRLLSEAYAAAIRVSVLQHQSLGGFADGCSWLDETYGLSSPEDERTFLPCSVPFTVTVLDVTDSSRGPITPPPVPTDDPGDFGEFATVLPTVTKNGVFS